MRLCFPPGIFMTPSPDSAGSPRIENRTCSCLRSFAEQDILDDAPPACLKRFVTRDVRIPCWVYVASGALSCHDRLLAKPTDVALGAHTLPPDASNATGDRRPDLPDVRDVRIVLWAGHEAHSHSRSTRNREVDRDEIPRDHGVPALPQGEYVPARPCDRVAATLGYSLRPSRQSAHL